MAQMRLTAAVLSGMAGLAIVGGQVLSAQVANNPYKVNYNWDKLEGRKIGVASGIKPDPSGHYLWILDRCGANGCAESPLDPIIQVDMEGKFVKSFGKGIMNFPHGFFVDREGNVWVTDGAPNGDARGAAGFKKRIGHQVYKFSPDGKLLMTLGEAGVFGADEKHFNGPTGVVVADNGDIWVSDGHGGPAVGPNKDNMYRSRGGNNRLVRFSRTANSSSSSAAASDPKDLCRCSSTIRTTSRETRKGASTWRTGATNASRCWTKRATSSPGGRSTANRARSPSIRRATSTSRTGCRTGRGIPAGSAASASAI